MHDYCRWKGQGSKVHDDKGSNPVERKSYRGVHFLRERRQKMKHPLSIMVTLISLVNALQIWHAPYTMLRLRVNEPSC